jgi:5S rRNA maturation endonuclease (ribonuclease M5)
MYRRRPNPDDPTKYLRNTKGCANVLYLLPKVRDAGTVLVVEGEPDVHRVWQLNLRDADGDAIAVTTNANGAGKWKSEYSKQLSGKNVILCGDNDEDGKGLRHMQSVELAIKGSVKDVRHIVLPSEYRDISRFLETHTAKDVIALVGEDWLELPAQI